MKSWERSGHVVCFKYCLSFARGDWWKLQVLCIVGKQVLWKHIISLKFCQSLYFPVNFHKTSFAYCVNIPFLFTASSACISLQLPLCLLFMIVIIYSIYFVCVCVCVFFWGGGAAVICSIFLCLLIVWVIEYPSITINFVLDCLLLAHCTMCMVVLYLNFGCKICRWMIHDAV
jgi:hypothetical protein